jgi:hypothetical protein
VTQDDVIEMARQVGLHLATDVNWMPIIGLEYAEKFAKLVAAKERERIIEVIESLGTWAHITEVVAEIRGKHDTQSID